MTTIRTPLATLVLIAAMSAPASASVRNFFSPESEGSRVAACLASNSECGKPAADAFCRAQGYDKAVLFERETHSLTRSIATGETCEGPSCTAFKQVKCFSVKDDLAAME